MEWRSIYNNICHIVNSLEKFGRFERRIVVIDLSAAEERARRYDFDDEDMLKEELLLAKENGLIDEILFAEGGRDETEKIRSRATRNAIFLTVLFVFGGMVYRVAKGDVLTVDSSSFLIFLLLDVLCVEFGIKKSVIDRAFKHNRR